MLFFSFFLRTFVSEMFPLFLSSKPLSINPLVYKVDIADIRIAVKLTSCYSVNMPAYYSHSLLYYPVKIRPALYIACTPSSKYLVYVTLLIVTPDSPQSSS